ncbi:hypothetical protein PUNSTDRAFT_85412 [Punctularia strigosozonata HHB-11173 SS5]|uniref:uncharacterized protein n=1 Tax=Punctularia strigosozonata (strain HHB-11173) TaxID=741275 RepID=UPI0004418261|nr:uncharacterized protein PUNSTDRAFT_85412 [Punctularia strigosozonata HHB-11173 SS5]EIN10953.1 hypothetical protein PUNSTDRAFT_85412 [Punctularia strigosozonata HHB-11173 SS5]
MATSNSNKYHIEFEDPSPQFANGLLDPENALRLHSEYASSEPYKHAKLDQLFQDELLVKVKDECLGQLCFTEKETDIYKVHQTGDLASLSFLSSEDLARLPSLLTLRNALYSPQFRSFVRTVTGCGPLSGSKQDMSVNTYKFGCHLLNHDDVIGTRRVSYILYMPLPHGQTWQPEWGGALELYATKDGPGGIPEPEALPARSIPPSWNQFIFFEVQPGKSFHSVEEVVVGKEEKDGRERLSISGWFHAAQPGEEDYVPEPAPELKSSREQLASSSIDHTPYADTNDPPLPDATLPPEHTSFLREFLNPVYLQPRTMRALAGRFVEESSLELHSFLSESLAARLLSGLRDADADAGLDQGQRQGRIPLHTAGLSGDWEITGPPHKWRYCTLRPKVPGSSSAVVEPRAANTSTTEIIRSLQDELFKSEAFRAWLATVSQMVPLSFAAQARRFRPGLDYTLATSNEKEARLDVVLGLTPEAQAREAKAKGKKKRTQHKPTGWETGLWGGWEANFWFQCSNLPLTCYMAPHEGDEDPAVYRSGAQRQNGMEGARATANGDDGQIQTSSAPSSTEEDQRKSSGDEDEDASMASASSDEDEDDGTLLTVQPGFNRMLMVLRDEGVLKFVKYVSAAAEGSRWDICGEYEIGALEEDED